MGSLTELHSYPVITAGTFGPLHDGHRALLETAIKQGNTIVGLTDDDLARNTRTTPRYVPSYVSRKAQLQEELVHLSRKHNTEYAILKISDPLRLATELSNVETLVVAPKQDALDRAEQINAIRAENGDTELAIVKADVKYAADGNPISSTRIINMEIDEHGNLIDSSHDT